MLRTSKSLKLNVQTLPPSPCCRGPPKGRNVPLVKMTQVGGILSLGVQKAWSSLHKVDSSPIYVFTGPSPVLSWVHWAFCGHRTAAVSRMSGGDRALSSSPEGNSFSFSLAPDEDLPEDGFTVYQGWAVGTCGHFSLPGVEWELWVQEPG